MRSISFTYKVALVFSILAGFCSDGIAQKPSPTPRQEKLLNGMKVLVWNVPAAEKTTIKIRFHSGSAFDPQDKEGVMALLSDSFFPTQESRDFFKNELGGSLDVDCNYDFIQITASAKNSEMLTLLETISQAVSNPDLGKEAAATLKTALTLRVSGLATEPAYVADLAVSKRLFGTFPYGRPAEGSIASIQKIDFADLKYAKDRLLTSDNATIAIEGNLDPALTFRAVRRYFGSWLKADKSIPSTFRQPDPPEKSPVKIEVPGLTSTEVRYAVRGYSRSSKDFAAAEVLAVILRSRFADAVGKSGGTNPVVSHDAHILPGAFVFKYRSSSPELIIRPDRGDGNQNAVFAAIYSAPATDVEFAAAKASVLANAERRDQLQSWLDVDTYKIQSPSDELRAFQAVDLADVRSLASKLAAEPVASAIVTGTAAATVSN